MSKTNIELFVANCPLCEAAKVTLAELACDGCDVTIHNLADGCDTGECHALAQRYGVSRVPAVVVDGQLADCCAGAISEQRLRDAGVGGAAS